MIFSRAPRSALTASIITALSLACTAGLASAHVNTDKAGVALEGYDPVAYFTQQKPVAGDPGITHAWGGATYRFASTANRDAFAKNPTRYAPQFGGYCAWAVSQGYTAPIDPAAWKVVDDKLYLNYSPSVQRQWEADQANLIRKGNANWPRLSKGKSPTIRR